MIRIGVVGLGARIATVIAAMVREEPSTRLVAVADPAPDAVRAHLAREQIGCAETRFVANADQLVEMADGLDGVIIGTRCDLHSSTAIKFAGTGLPLFLEKPVGTSLEQLEALWRALAHQNDSIVVSFPLRMTPLFDHVLRIVRSGRLGTVNQVQASNFVPYGGVYYGQWYRDHDITGGLWLQKATHDFDYITQLVGRSPVAVVAMGSRCIFGGPMAADLRCSRCDRTDSCKESPRNSALRQDDGGMGVGDHWCAFSTSIKHHDAATAIIRYDNDVHASYAQNFISRRGAARRGARITGYEATLEFDWYRDAITVFEHHGRAVEEIKVSIPQGHFGGDTVLARHFIDVVQKRDQSRAPLSAGVLSAALCLAARDADENRCYRLFSIQNGICRLPTTAALPSTG